MFYTAPSPKVLEKAPAIGISDKERKKIGSLCVKACENMKYRGAGTFEFLYEKGHFYFIEMNTGSGGASSYGDDYRD